MPQIHIDITPDFERDLSTLMRSQALSNTSEAIRRAVAAQARAAEALPLRRDFSALIGLAQPQRPDRCAGDAALWEAESPDGR